LLAPTALLVVLLPPVQLPAVTVPSGFSVEVVASGFTAPTAFVFLPDGRILVAEKSGLVRLVKSGVVVSTPFIDIRDRVNDYWDRGLLGIAADPSFATNGFVYLLYTYENDPAQWNAGKTARLTRVTAVGDTASPASEVVILGTVVGSTCSGLPRGADCIPSESPSHTVGSVKFGSDGTMFVTTGDGAHFNIVSDDALRAQDIDSLAGKMLHITPDGRGLPGNPFWNGDPVANQSKVWAYGLRNPFRSNLRPGTNIPYVGDVGWTQWEEVNVARAGTNMGWPCYEGPDIQSGYATYPDCQALYALGAGAVQAPLVTYDHSGGSASVTGGSFYSGTAFPPEYQGAYFFGDYAQNWLHVLHVDASDQPVGPVAEFGTELDGPVAIEMAPDGTLHYLAINVGELRRIRYAAGNTAPTAQAVGSPTSGLAPLTVQFSSAGSADPDGDPLVYGWDFGDGATAAEPNPRHTYAANGTFTARLVVRDSRGETGMASVPITVGDRAPTAMITGPSASLTYRVGQVIAYSGTGTDDEDGALAGSALMWQILLQHCPGDVCHTHFFTTSTGSGGSFTVPDHGDDSHFDIVLTATDSRGLTGTASVSIFPQTVPVTLATAPGSLQVAYDGRGATAPLTITTIVGSTHTITAPSPQGSAIFAGWSDGGAAQHNVTVGASPVTYTATFTGPSCPMGQLLAEYFNNATVSESPVFTRCESTINHVWGLGGPGNGVGADNFSVRWRGSFNFAGGSTTFTATADDGIRVWVDGQLIIDAWVDQAATTYQATVDLAAGAHDVKVEYYEHGVSALAQVSWPTAPSGGSCASGQFLAQYFANTTLGGSPFATRCEAAVSYVWGAGGPDTGVGPDNFSVRWAGQFQFAGGSTTFTATADDGIRVWVDGTLVIDAWVDQSATTYQATRTLTAGTHLVQVEYYERTGDAVAQLSWAQAPGSGSCPSGQFLAEYFNNLALTGTPTFTRCETAIAYNWGAGGPGAGVATDNFSVLWTGRFPFPAGRTTFTATADDGIRVWVDGTPIIDAWRDQSATTYRQARTLAAGDHEVRVEYYERAGDAVAQVGW
jgi:glucose/arabinose dehydrogenase/PKD repeat protein